MAMLARLTRALRGPGRVVRARAYSTGLQVSAPNFYRFFVLGIGLFTPAYLLVLERWMRRKTFQTTESHLPLPPPLEEDEVESVVEAEMQQQAEALQEEIVALVTSGAMDDILMNHISDLVSFWTQRKDYGRAIRLAERLAAASPQPRVRKELQGSLALLYFEQSLRQPPADATKSRKQSRALAERTLAEKGVGPEGKAAVATVLFTMALWDRNVAAAHRYLPLLPPETQEGRRHQLRVVEAEPAFDAALRANPQNVTALLQKGWALLFTGQYDAARDVLLRALRVEPPPTTLLQAAALGVLFSPADPFYQTLYQKYAGIHLDQAMASAPTLPALNLLCSLHARSQAEPERVLEEFEGLFPDVPPKDLCRLLGCGFAAPEPQPGAPELAFHDQRLGEYFLQRGFEGADGYNAAYYGWLAKLYHGVGLPLAEAACLQRGLDFSPKCPGLRQQQQSLQLQYGRLVDLLLRRGRFPQG